MRVEQLLLSQIGAAITLTGCLASTLTIFGIEPALAEVGSEGKDEVVGDDTSLSSVNDLEIENPPQRGIFNPPSPSTEIPRLSEIDFAPTRVEGLFPKPIPREKSASNDLAQVPASVEK